MLKNAKWIKSPINEIDGCYEFYLDINTEKQIKKAELFISALGLYRAFIDGKRVGNEVFTPYFTDYITRTQYQTYDVTDMLETKSRLSVICGEGWAVGNVWGRHHYNDNISLIFALNITFSDGTSKTYYSDTNTFVRTCNIINSSIYDGETIDNTAEITEFGNALIDSKVNVNLIPQEGEDVTEQEIITPVALIETPLGEKVIDFGQNLAGYVEVTIDGNYGDVIEINHAEVLDKDGNFYTKNLRAAKQTNTYVLSGNGIETFKPTFTWQGFRYIRLNKFPFDKVDLNCFKAIAVHSDMERTGDFSCGNAKINQLYHNVIWGQKSNFIDIPTDCPQRDERVGWTGDAQIFIKTAAMNFDVEKFFKKWLHDLAANQMCDGSIPSVIPNFNNDRSEKACDPENVSPAWCDAATICPWELYLAYGDKVILKDQFESMKNWVEYIHKAGPDEFLWLDAKGYGDWLGMDNEEGSYVGATPRDYIGSAFYAYSTKILIDAGEIIGENVDNYKKLYENIVVAFREKFMENDIPICETQTACALALYFNLCANPQKTADKLNDLIIKNGTKLTTGFVGTPYLLSALSENGYMNTAYDLLLQEGYPSWLYAVNHGATTMWEHWDGIKEDGSFWSDDMNSYNHYAYGSIFSWIFTTVCGINVLKDGAGYSKFFIKPYPDKRLGFANLKYKTKFGEILSNWYYDFDNKIHFEFSIPNGTEATIQLPNGFTAQVKSGKYIYTI